MKTLGTYRVYHSEYRRSATILIFTFSWGPPFGFFSLISYIFKQKSKGGTPWKCENQNGGRSLILALVNPIGTQSLHAKFQKKSLLGRLNNQMSWLHDCVCLHVRNVWISSSPEPLEVLKHQWSYVFTKNCLSHVFSPYLYTKNSKKSIFA